METSNEIIINSVLKFLEFSIQLFTSFFSIFKLLLIIINKKTIRMSLEIEKLELIFQSRILFLRRELYSKERLHFIIF